MSNALQKIGRECKNNYVEYDNPRRPHFNDKLLISIIRHYKFEQKDTYKCLKDLSKSLEMEGHSELSSSFGLCQKTLLSCKDDRFYLGIVTVKNEKHMEYLERRIYRD